MFSSKLSTVTCLVLGIYFTPALQVLKLGGGGYLCVFARVCVCERERERGERESLLYKGMIQGDLSESCVKLSTLHCLKTKHL